jgi:hypothetical protein
MGCGGRSAAVACPLVTIRSPGIGRGHLRVPAAQPSLETSGYAFSTARQNSEIGFFRSFCIVGHAVACFFHSLMSSVVARSRVEPKKERKVSSDMKSACASVPGCAS